MTQAHDFVGIMNNEGLSICMICQMDEVDHDQSQGCDCEQPYEDEGLRLVSNRCPIHTYVGESHDRD